MGDRIPPGVLPATEVGLLEKTMDLDSIQILLEANHVAIAELEAVAADGNAFDCGLANRLGLPFEAWLRWASLPNANANAERWAKRILAELA